MLTTYYSAEMPKSAVQCDLLVRSLVEGHELTGSSLLLEHGFRTGESCASVPLLSSSFKQEKLGYFCSVF
jgi:hypothetical protein